MCCGTTTTLIQMSCSASPISYATRTFAALAPCRSLRLPTMLTLLRSVPATILLRKNMTGRSTINYVVQVLKVQVFNKLLNPNSTSVFEKISKERVEVFWDRDQINNRLRQTLSSNSKQVVRVYLCPSCIWFQTFIYDWLLLPIIGKGWVCCCQHGIHQYYPSPPTTQPLFLQSINITIFKW